jgi:membrane protein
MRQATSGVTRQTISLPLLAIAAVGVVTFRSKLRILDEKPQPQRGSRVLRPASAKRAAKEDIDRPTQGAWMPPWPWQISLRHWRAILARTYSEINEDRMMAVAGGVVFFILLAIFPGITAFVSLYALFADPATISSHLAAAADMMPTEAFNLLSGEVERVASKGPGTLGLASIFGLLFAFWSANSGMKAIFDALNVANDETEKRGFFKLNLVSLAFTLGTIAFMLLAVGAVVLVPLLFGQIGLQDFAGVVISVLRWPALFILLAAALSLLYVFGPSKPTARWNWMTTGSLAATFLWVLAGAIFSWYLAHVADYSATYGTLGGAIGLMMWLWISFLVILAGAELDQEISHEFANDAVDSNQPMATQDKPDGSSEMGGRFSSTR